LQLPGAGRLHAYFRSDECGARGAPDGRCAAVKHRTSDRFNLALGAESQTGACRAGCVFGTAQGSQRPEPPEGSSAVPETVTRGLFTLLSNPPDQLLGF